MRLGEMLGSPAPAMAEPSSRPFEESGVAETDMPLPESGPPEAEQAIYSHRLEDGRVVTARSIEQVMEKCPVLGKMSLEAAGVLLEDSKIPISDQTAKAPPRPPSITLPPKAPKIDVAKRVKQETAPTAPIVTAVRPEATPEQPTGRLIEAHQVEQIIHAIKPESAEEVSEEAHPQREMRINEPAVEEVVPIAEHRPKPETVILPEARERIPIETEPQNGQPEASLVRVAVEEDVSPQELHEDRQPVTEPVTDQHEAGQADRRVIEEDMLGGTQEARTESETSAAYDEDAVEMTAVIDAESSDTGAAAGTVEAVYDEEVTETYDQLLALAEVERQPVSEESAEIDIALQLVGGDELSSDNVIVRETPDEAVEVAEEVAPPAATFQEYVAARPEIEQPADLEAVRAVADEQPVEETLAQVAEQLTQLSEVPENNEIVVVLRELTELLPEPADAAGEAVDIGPTEWLTPEVTTKLLVLLREAGYSDPQEALVTFVSQHGFSYLLDTIYYMNQALNPEDRYGFRPVTGTAAASMPMPLASSIGAAVFSLLMDGRRATEPVLVDA